MPTTPERLAQRHAAATRLFRAVEEVSSAAVELQELYKVMDRETVHLEKMLDRMIPVRTAASWFYLETRRPL